MPVLNCILKCTHCGTPTEVMLQTYGPHPLTISELIKQIGATHLCGKCRARYNWLAAQGRGDEFHQQPVAEVLKPAGYREPQ